MAQIVFKRGMAPSVTAEITEWLSCGSLRFNQRMKEIEKRKNKTN